MGCTPGKEGVSGPPPTADVKKITPNPAVPFAVMRNSHEAMRMSIKNVLSIHIENGDIAKFRVAWIDFQRAMEVHMEMEDKDMFPLLNSVSGNQLVCFRRRN